MKTNLLSEETLKDLENLYSIIIENIPIMSKEDLILLASLSKEELNSQQIAEDLREIFERILKEKAQRSIHDSYIVTKLGASS